ncbi:kelch-like protein 26 [Branchiostoma floridae x Branchiostoma japonicum]
MADGGCVEDSENVHRTLSDPTFGNDMLSVLNDMRVEGVILDVTVVVGEEEFMAHSTVLAYGSDFFRRLFASGMEESRSNRVKLRDPCITREGFRLLLNFLYSGEFVVSIESVYDVLLVANHLQVQPVLKLCYDFISQNMREAPLDLSNYTKAEEVASVYGLTTLQEKVDSTLAENFLELSTSEDFLKSTTADQLAKLLQLDDLVSPTELEVYEAVVRWLMHDEHTRMPHAAEVLSHVRFALLDQNTLYGLLQTDMGAEENCRQLILEAMAYHSLSPEIKGSIDWPRSRPRTKLGKKVLMAITSSRKYRIRNKSWTMQVARSRPDGSICAAAVVGNVLYAVFKNSFQFYVPTTNTWTHLKAPSGLANSKSPIMTAIDTRLFLVYSTSEGDFQSSRAQCYDIPKGRWMRIPSFPRSTDGVTLTSCQGAVYAIGGNVHGIVGDKQAVAPRTIAAVDNLKPTAVPTSAVQKFLPPNNFWEAVSPTTHPHSGATAMVRGDIIYIAGGKTFINGETTSSTIVEMCRTGLRLTMKESSPWSVVPQPPCVHKFASQVAVIDRKAYFILGGQMHFTGKFVDAHTLEEDVEDMCQGFGRHDLDQESVICATFAE